MVFGSSLVASPLLLLLHVLLFVSIGAAAAESAESSRASSGIEKPAEQQEQQQALEKEGTAAVRARKGDTAKALKLVEQGGDMEWQNPNAVSE